MSYQDQPRHRHSSRYPTLAQYEDSYPPYQGSQGYQSYQDTSYQSYQDTSYQDTEAGYRRGNRNTDGYRGFGGLTVDRDQRPPWDNQRDQPTEWQPASARRTSGPFFAASDDDYDDYEDDGYGYPGRRPSRLVSCGTMKPARWSWSTTV